ncbi:MAG: VacB/RNase II family 3'-5' exoribonuclease, partial [Candidatus Subteraquimicrobiales bacterium]|nr:VacB/RNase II family 3'-5' exoribonuclease [Candidatus Subteraquimicrobiales bacterium]
SAEKGDIVVVQIDQSPDKRHGPVGRIIENLGNENQAGISVEVVVREYELPLSFSSSVLKECEEISDVVISADIYGRKDYREEFAVTIDGLDAKDFDDAVSIKKIGDKFHLIVHIADVSHYVATESLLDEEAFERGFSAYLVDRVIPMLPHKLSNGICSLNPDVDRLTFSVEMVINSKGEIEDFLITEGVINSKARLTYEEADKTFATGDFRNKEVKDCLILLRELSDILEDKRIKRGSVNFETIEPKVILNKELKPVEVLIREKTPATKLIEETMILTNEVVANFMHQNDAPMVYRVHDKPDLEALTQIGELIKELGYPIKDMKSTHPKVLSNVLQKIINFAHNRPEKLLINYLMLRTMKQAKYSPGCSLHFGLASDCYTHFTSPIRRYTDLVVHRFVKGVLKKKLSEPYLLDLADGLGDICEHCSVKEREIVEAERESVEVKLCELMRSQIGEIFWGIITGV